MKPEPPEYPRNVPDIDCDEDILLPCAVVYTRDEDDADDAEALAKIRAAKRRRIEANAHAYLRGEALSILSAGLRGPFDNGWRNPWAAKNNKWKHEVVDGDTAVSRAQKMLRKDVVGSQTPWKSNHTRQRAAQATANPFERARSEHVDQPSPEQKVENWLRRNSALPQQCSFVEPTSPTAKKQLPTPSRLQSSRQDWTPTKQVINISSQDVHAPIHHPDQRVAESFETVVPNGKRSVDPANAHLRLQNALETASPETTRKEQHSAEQIADEKVEESSRAEAAIISMKRRVLDAGNMPPDSLQVTKHAAHMLIAAEHEANRTAPKPETSDKHVQQPHPSPVASEIKLKQLEASIDSQLQQGGSEELCDDQAEANEGNLTTTAKFMIPPRSTAASGVQSTSFVPSAQPRPELQTSTSNVSSGALLSKAIEVITENSAALSDKGVQHNVQGSPEQTSKPGIIALGDVDKRKSPMPTKKARTSHKRKSASFAADPPSLSWNGSIKSVLKTQKASQVAKPPFRKASPPPFYNEAEIDMDTSIEQMENSPSGPEITLHSPRTTKKQPAKSILKSTNTPSFTAATLSSKPADKLPEPVSSSHDLLMSGQNGVAHEDNEPFDLDGAINDMGSFLSTWEEERDGVRAL